MKEIAQLTAQHCLKMLAIKIKCTKVKKPTRIWRRNSQFVASSVTTHINTAIFFLVSCYAANVLLWCDYQIHIRVCRCGQRQRYYWKCVQLSSNSIPAKYLGATPKSIRNWQLKCTNWNYLFIIKKKTFSQRRLSDLCKKPFKVTCNISYSIFRFAGNRWMFFSWIAEV